MAVRNLDHSDLVRATNADKLDTEFWLCSKKSEPLHGLADNCPDMADARPERSLDLFFGQLFRKLFERGGLEDSKRWLDKRFEPLP